MRAIEFPQVNVRIAEHQPEFETLPVHVVTVDGKTSEITMCFKLDAEEVHQVIATGEIWLTIAQPESDFFHPIFSSCLKPEFK